MKKIIVMLAAAFLLLQFGTAASAATGSGSQPLYEIDGSLGFGSGPGDFDAGYDLNFGAGTLLPTIDSNLQARIDISYFTFSTDFFGASLDFTRLPVTVSARYYLPIADRLKAFVQAGVETSFDSKDSLYAFGGFVGKQTKNEVNIGLTPGGGIEFSINPQFSIFALGRMHLISDSYISMDFGGAFHF